MPNRGKLKGETMEFFFIYHLADAIGQIIDHMNEELGYEFFFTVGTNQLCGEGEFALPLHTDDLWGTCLQVMGMTQREFNELTMREIDDAMLRNAY